MARPAFPTLVAFTFINKPEVVPLKHLPGAYAVVVPAGKEAFVIGPGQILPVNHTPDVVAQMLEHAAARDQRWVAYGAWTIRATMGAWLHLGTFKTIFADLLTTIGLLPVEPGTATVGDRSRAFARLWIRRLMGQAALIEPDPIPEANTIAGGSTAPRPSVPATLAARSKPAPTRVFAIEEDAPAEDGIGLGA